MRNPGEPLNALNLPANQGIGFIYAPGYYGVANPAYPKGIKLPHSIIPVQKAYYGSKDIPFQSIRAEYKS